MIGFEELFCRGGQISSSIKRIVSRKIEVISNSSNPIGAVADLVGGVDQNKIRLKNILFFPFLQLHLCLKSVNIPL
jgi:hypothetical protein